MAEQCGRFGVPQLGPKINAKQGGRLGAPQLDPKITTLKKKLSASAAYDNAIHKFFQSDIPS